MALLAFVALELCYSNPSNPRALAFAIALYSYVALFGMLAFGRETWTTRGEGFAILFAYIARIAPLVAREGRIRLRLPLTGLAGAEHVPGSVAVPRRRARLGRVRRLQPHDRRGRTSSRASRRRTSSTGPGTGELLVTRAQPRRPPRSRIALVLVAFLAACAIARSTVSAPRPLAPEFVLSLVPIALVYAVAHYFSLFVIQGQFVVPLLSDPFGKGWDLFGTAGVQPEPRACSGRTRSGTSRPPRSCSATWQGSRSPTTGPSRSSATASDALRSQYAMLALMVVYTVGGLWLLSRG